MATITRSTRRLIVKQLDDIHLKAAAWDQAVEWMQGRMDNEKLMVVYKILTRNVPHA